MWFLSYINTIVMCPTSNRCDYLGWGFVSLFHDHNLPSISKKSSGTPNFFFIFVNVYQSWVVFWGHKNGLDFLISWHYSGMSIPPDKQKTGRTNWKNLIFIIYMFFILKVNRMKNMVCHALFLTEIWGKIPNLSGLHLPSYLLAGLSYI